MIDHTPDATGDTKAAAAFHGLCQQPHGCVSPEAPPHICVRLEGHEGPHGDFSGFSWTQPEPKHDWRVAP